MLSSVTLPWLGTTCTSRATGLPGSAVALSLFGFAATATPLAAILPQGGSGCTLLVDPLACVFAVPAGGQLLVSTAIPNQPGLVGIVLRQQVLSLDLGPLGGVVAATATNALAATLGVL